MIPVLDPAVSDFLDFTVPKSPDAEKMFLTAPVRWIDGPAGALEALGVGSINGVQRMEKVAVMRAEAAINAFSPPGTPGMLSMSHYFTSQSPPGQNAVATNKLQPQPAPNGYPQPVPEALKNEEPRPPISRETSGYVTPPSDPSELKRG